MIKKVEVSYRTIVFTAVLILFLWLIYVIQDILMQFFVALLIMAVLNPQVTKLSKHKIPRAVSVLFIYLILFAVVSFVVGAIVPPSIEQTSAFVSNFPKFMENLGISAVLSDQIVYQFVSEIGALPARVAKLTLSIFSNFLNVITVLVLAFYLLSEREKLDTQLVGLLGDHKRKDFSRIIDKLETQLGGWARGQLGLMFVVGATSYVGFRLLGISFALPLSILAGLLEIIPYIGPIIAAIPAVIIGFGTSPILGVAAAALAFLVQQLENYVFVPKILQKSTGVNPVITLLSLAIGFRLAGLTGLIISVPVFITTKILVQEYLLSK